MSDIVERLREASVERQQIAWGRIDGGQEWSIAADLADQAAGEIERLRSENALHASRYEDACSIINRIWALFGTPSYAELNGRSIYDLIAGTQKENAILRARVAELEAEAFKLAANQCHHGYGTENGDHRCKYQDRIAELEENRDCSISFRGFKLSGSAESTAEVRRLLRVEERLAGLEAAQEWRPIESAPRDTKAVVMLALKNGHVATARRWSANIDRWTSLDGECDYTSASHWMPLPAPPKVAT